MPPEPIYVYEYLLRSGVALNSASHRRTFPGALIRVGSGFGCVHPWPEFGDALIEEQANLVGASRGYQANLLVMQKLRSMTEALLRVGQQ